MKPVRLITNLLFVNDVRQSANYYEKLFQIAPVEISENFCSFEFGGTFFNIHPADSKSPISRGGSVSYWLVDNFEEFVEHAKYHGCCLYRGPLYVREIDRNICQLEDPFGNIIGIEG